jgi:PPOX class probable F420-dependent enzyme
MSRRDQIALSAAEQEELLRTRRTIILSTLDRRGYPHSVPMWYIARDGRIQMTTYAKSQKTLNLQRDPRCSLLVEDGEEYEVLRGILIRGRATIVSDVDAVVDTLVHVHKKHGLAGSRDELAEIMRAQAAKRVLLDIQPERVSSWDHRKLGGVY